MCLLFAPVLSAVAQQQATPPVEASRYPRFLGPYQIEGRRFTIKLSVLCLGPSLKSVTCGSHVDDTVEAVDVLDESGKVHFHKSFPPISDCWDAADYTVSCYGMYATLLEGREHRALQLTYQRFPTAGGTGASSQLFAMRNGALQALNSEPVGFGDLELPRGPTDASLRLMENDTFNVVKNWVWFRIVVHYRVNFEDFRLEDLDKRSEEYDVLDDGRDRIESENIIHLYHAPDSNTEPSEVHVTPASKVRLLKGRVNRFMGPENNTKYETWLKIQLDGKDGWILEGEDFPALGLQQAD